MCAGVQFARGNSSAPKYVRNERDLTPALRNGRARKARAGEGEGGWWNWSEKRSVKFYDPKTRKELRTCPEQLAWLKSLPADGEMENWMRKRWNVQIIQCARHGVVMPPFKKCKLHVKHILCTEICCVCMKRSEGEEMIDIECSRCRRWSHRTCTDNKSADLKCLEEGDSDVFIVESGEVFVCKMCR